jgi:4-hydroxy-tetrahydrodipicolinate synthase
MRTLRAGGVGCISATANVNPKAIANLAANWHAADADQRQADLDQVRAIFQKYQMIVALKTALAYFSKDADWLRLRPPLMSLGADQQKKLITELEQIHFSMPGL